MRLRLFKEITACSGWAMEETFSRIPLRNAPPPRDPQQVFPIRGRCTTPAWTSPASSSAMRTLHSGFPRRKSRVPSIGSMIQRRPFFVSFREPSSPRIPSSGKASSSNFAISFFALFIGDRNGRIVGLVFGENARFLMAQSQLRGKIRGPARYFNLLTIRHFPAW